MQNSQMNNEEQDEEEIKPPKIDFHMLKPVSRGLGIRISQSEHEKRVREQEEKAYAPFCKRIKNDEENFRYIQEHYETNKNDFASSSQFQDIKMDTDECDQETLSLYESLSNPNYNEELPIFKIKEQLKSVLISNNVLIIQGNTGCGKTTQVPQMILDYYAQLKKKCKIIVTQPRRLAAVSICKRVCEERNWQVGWVCGYKIALDKRCSDITKIIYATTGYLLKEITSNIATLEEYTHIILDEIHDRELDTDLILLLIKIMLLKKYSGKIILMSATLDPTVLVNYFKEVSIGSDVPILRCELQMHSVKEFYLNEISRLFEFKYPTFNLDEPYLDDELLFVVEKLLDYFDEEEIKATDQRNEQQLPLKRGSVLIFAPGMEEITRVMNHLNSNLSNKFLKIFPLHSEIPFDQQALVLKKLPNGLRKVIISTSIAESSITVPDVKYVIDFGLTKVLHCDQTTNFSSLKLEWASKSNMNQRKGRAGRVSNGFCYRLITREFYKKMIQEFPKPAILRQPLDKLILNIKRFSLNKSPKQILALALTPPPEDNIDRTILYLKEVGALTLFKNGEFCKDDGELTYAGRIMNDLPVDLKLAKLILFGHVFGRTREAVIIAAALSLRSFFSKYFNSAFEAYSGKLAWSKGLFCDFNLIINAYNTWIAKRTKVNQRDMSKWERENMLESSKFKDLQNAKNEIEKHLKEHKIPFKGDSEIQEHEILTEQQAVDENYLIKFMVAGAFYPNYYKTLHVSSTEIIRALASKDPHSTIAIKGFPSDENAVLYKPKLKQLFSIFANDLAFHFERNKAFIEFNKFSEEATKISYGIYKSMALSKFASSQLRVPYVKKDLINILNRKIQDLRNGQIMNYDNNFTSRISTGITSDPNLLLNDMNEFFIDIIEVVAVGHFWAQIREKKYIDQIRFIYNELNEQIDEMKVLDLNELYVGQLVATLHFDSSFECGIYRARVLEINENSIKVFYVDYGNVEKKDSSLIFELASHLAQLPPLAIECKLINVGLHPLRRNNPQLIEEATNEFSSFIKKIDSNLKAKVYSIVDNVVRISLIDCSSSLFEYDISVKLKKIGLIEEQEETDLSKQKHHERMNYAYNGKSKSEWIQLKNLESVLKDVKYEEESQFELRPYTPLECKLKGLTQYTSAKTDVRIDRDSVNYVLLDEDPEIKCSSLVVAHKNEKSPRSDGIILRNTCLFPKLRGIVSLCLLVFAPTAELRVDKKLKIYTGALCGLGYTQEHITNNNKTIKITHPLYTENDVEDVFEVHFDESDLKLINSVRHCFNLIIGSESQYENVLKNKKLEMIQKNNRMTLLALLKKERKIMENPIYFNHEYKWNQLDEHCYDIDHNRAKLIKKSRLENQFFYATIDSVDFSKLTKTY